jgi:hypothetical protein
MLKAELIVPFFAFLVFPAGHVLAGDAAGHCIVATRLALVLVATNIPLAVKLMDGFFEAP